MGAFVAKLCEREAITSIALEFLILTAARTGEVLGAEWPEFDLEGKVWTVSAKRMKSNREHRVPLSPRGVEIIEKLRAARTGAFVFPGQRLDKPLSGTALVKAQRRMGVHDATVHGFRSNFRDWCGEETNFPREIAEAALANVTGDKAERAYQRGKTQGVRSEVWGPERRLNGTANATIGVPTCDAGIEPDEHEAILGAKSAKIRTLNDRFRKSLDRRTRHDDRRR